MTKDGVGKRIRFGSKCRALLAGCVCLLAASAPPRDNDCVLAVAISSDGKMAASSKMSGGITLWDLTTCKEIETFADEGVYGALAWSPDGRYIVSGGTRSKVGTELWDVAKKERVRLLERSGRSLYSVAFSPDGKTVAAPSVEQDVKLWDVESGKIVRQLNGHAGGVSTIAFSPDGQFLASGGGFDLTAIVWNLADGKPVCTLAGHDGTRVTSVSFSTSGRHLLTTDGKCRLWEVASGREVLCINKPKYICYATFFVNDTEILTANCDGNPKCWDIVTGSLVRTIPYGWRPDNVALLPDGKRGLIYSGEDISLWDLKTGTKITDLKKK